MSTPKGSPFPLDSCCGLVPLIVPLGSDEEPALVTHDRLEHRQLAYLMIPAMTPEAQRHDQVRVCSPAHAAVSHMVALTTANSMTRAAGQRLNPAHSLW